MEARPSSDHEESLRVFDLLMERQGIRVPTDRRLGAFAVHLELSQMAERLRVERPAESEPSNVFTLTALLREADSNAS
ncbi:hypothetical protein [Streptomyces regalis]|uniref:hypothetical protein n=1 Tax=Streptomyces regalis TaxID=68262 RepID=UPI000A73B401|nr:hypothetical protein [Streptomyces regalis]